ncbi:hypothetical protein HDZ31DRAFT_76266 [Schizophyllum fasciatum]
MPPKPLALTKSASFVLQKRKRDEDPLDALVIESAARKHKSRDARGVFKFSETLKGGTTQAELEQKLKINLTRVSDDTFAGVPIEDTVMADTHAPSPEEHAVNEASKQGEDLRLHNALMMAEEYISSLGPEPAFPRKIKKLPAPGTLFRKPPMPKPQFTFTKDPEPSRVPKVSPAPMPTFKGPVDRSFFMKPASSIGKQPEAKPSFKSKAPAPKSPSRRESDDDVYHVYARHDVPDEDGANFYDSAFFDGKKYVTVTSELDEDADPYVDASYYEEDEDPDAKVWDYPEDESDEEDEPMPAGRSGLRKDRSFASQTSVDKEEEEELAALLSDVRNGVPLSPKRRR